MSPRCANFREGPPPDHRSKLLVAWTIESAMVILQGSLRLYVCEFDYLGPLSVSSAMSFSNNQENSAAALTKIG
jgi:hypothetical protein